MTKLSINPAAYSRKVDVNDWPSAHTKHLGVLAKNGQ